MHRASRAASESPLRGHRDAIAANYTAITRAREAVTVWGDELVLGAGVERRLVRSSGLRDALWGPGGA